MLGGHRMAFWNKVLESLKSPETRAYEEQLREEQAKANKAMEEQAKLEEEQFKRSQAEAKKKAAADKRKATLEAKKKAEAEAKKKAEAEAKKKKKSPKELATAKGEPYISVLAVDLDKKNLGNGSFELDWNEIFVKELRAAGYPGKTDEDVVDMWFRSICRNVLAETFEQDAAQKHPDNVRYINRKIGDDGRTEVS